MVWGTGFVLGFLCLLPDCSPEKLFFILWPVVSTSSSLHPHQSKALWTLSPKINQTKTLTICRYINISTKDIPKIVHGSTIHSYYPWIKTTYISSTIDWINCRIFIRWNAIQQLKKKESTADECNNMGESQRQKVEWKKADTKVYSIWFYLYEVQVQA